MSYHHLRSLRSHVSRLEDVRNRANGRRGWQLAVPLHLLNAPLPIVAPTHAFMHILPKYNMHETFLLRKRQ
jgi:hypothetical protein